MGVITYNTLDSTDYGIQVETPPGYHIPTPDIESSHIPGRNGDILFNPGTYKNVTREYECSFGKYKGDFQNQMEAVLAWLYSVKKYADNAFDLETYHDSTKTYVRLQDTYDPDHFRYATLSDEVSVENILGQGGKFTLSFNCKPERYLTLGEHKYTATYGSSGLSIVAINTTNFEAKPIYKIHESNSAMNHYIQVTTLDETGSLRMKRLNIKPGFGEMVIDTEKQDCYNGSINCNSYISWNLNMAWPTIPPKELSPSNGSFTINTDNGLDLLEVQYRWWTI